VVNQLARIAAAADALNQAIARAVRWLALVMVLITVGVVILRYAFNTGTIVMQESVMYLHAILFMLGIPYGLGQNAHVRVDVFFSKLQRRRQRWIDIAGHVLFLVPVSSFIFLTSLPYVASAWRVLEGSAEVGGIPGIFLLKTLIPVMAVLLFLQGLVEITKCLTEQEQSRA